MSVLAGVGTAGVPAKGIGVILGVDRLLDMCRTMLNVTGDITAATFVARSEGPLRVPDDTEVDALDRQP